MSKASSSVLIDPEVSKKKFHKELAKYLSNEKEYRRRGWILEACTYPLVKVTFLSRHVIPRIAVCTVDIDFSNYDIIPPSVIFRDPLTDELALSREQNQPPLNENRQVVIGTGFSGIQIMHYILFHIEEKRAFLCWQGVREYHDHPQHNNDPWFRYRSGNIGSLIHILERIDTLCIEPLKGIGVASNRGNPIHEHKMNDHVR